MATFKVGQRVRVVHSVGVWPEAVGREATIVLIGPGPDALPWIPDRAHWIAVDGLPSDGPRGATSWAHSDQLAPLTDPAADAFLESIRKMKPYSEPIREQTFVERWGELVKR